LFSSGQPFTVTVTPLNGDQKGPSATSPKMRVLPVGDYGDSQSCRDGKPGGVLDVTVGTSSSRFGMVLTSSAEAEVRGLGLVAGCWGRMLLLSSAALRLPTSCVTVRPPPLAPHY